MDKLSVAQTELRVNSTEPTYFKYIDYLNVLACLAVVIEHCNGCFWHFADARFWKTSVFIQTTFYWPIPIFFMITGILLLNYRKKYDTKTFFKKRILRTFIPFLFWSVFVIVLKTEVGAIQLGDISFTFIIDAIVNHKYFIVYWYFIPLFGVYLSLPVLSLIPAEKKKKVYTYLAFYSFITASILPFSFTLLGIKFNPDITAPIAGGYLMFVFLGYLLAYCYSFTLKQRYIIYLMGFVGWCVRTYTVYFWSLADGKVNNTMGGYFNLPTLSLAIAVFVFVQYDLSSIKVFTSERIYRIVHDLSKHSLAVYLLHDYFVSYMPRVFGFSNHSIWFRTMGVVVIYTLCILISVCIKRIPYVRRILP